METNKLRKYSIIEANYSLARKKNVSYPENCTSALITIHTPSNECAGARVLTSLIILSNYSTSAGTFEAKLVF